MSTTTTKLETIYQVGISENSTDEDIRVFATDKEGKIHTFTSPDDFAKALTEYIADEIEDLYKEKFKALKFKLITEITEKHQDTD